MSRRLNVSVTKSNVLRIKEELKEYGVIYYILTQLAQSDLFIRMRRDRELDEINVTGVKKQLKQAERDLDFLVGLKHALDFFLTEVDKCNFFNKERTWV